MKKGKKTYRLKPVFAPTDIRVLVNDQGCDHIGLITDVKYDVKGRIYVYCRI